MTYPKLAHDCPDCPRSRDDELCAGCKEAYDLGCKDADEYFSAEYLFSVFMYTPEGEA